MEDKRTTALRPKSEQRVMRASSRRGNGPNGHRELISGVSPEKGINELWPAGAPPAAGLKRRTTGGSESRSACWRPNVSLASRYADEQLCSAPLSFVFSVSLGSQVLILPRPHFA
ncbi:hypothetical protein EYF80_013019 [Liparis tanakae]|uniref:Uncharacterized protein n=1 Tax=Liparis tanakae TaxID=230148 RepID=A0A4Z2IFT4_9TELE|nr:hypothetical protein EYF80_013019 [Liparis tanakae]